MKTKELTKEHIKYAKATQLAELLAKHLPTISRWNHTGFVPQTIELQYPCMEKSDLVAGLVERQDEFNRIKKIQDELEEVLDFYRSTKKPA